MMDLQLVNWVIGLVSDYTGAAVTTTAALGGSVAFYRRRVKKSSTRSFWGKQRSQTVLVYPKYEGTKIREEDVAARMIIQDSLTSISVNYTAEEVTAPARKNSRLVLICGPKSNSASRAFADRSLTRVQFREGTTELPPHFFDTETHTRYFSPSDSEPGTGDVAVAVRHVQDDRTTFLFWGIHGLGTLGAASILSSDDILKRIKRDAANGSFMVFLGVSPRSGTEVPNVQIISNVFRL